MQVYECLLSLRPGDSTTSVWRRGRGRRPCPSHAVTPSDFSSEFTDFLAGTSSSDDGGGLAPVYEVPALRLCCARKALGRPSARGLLRGHSRAWSLHASSHYRLVLDSEGRGDGGRRRCGWGDGALLVLAHYAAASVAPREGLPPRCPAAPDALRAADHLRGAARIALAHGRGTPAAAAALGLLRRAGFLLDLAVAGATAADGPVLALAVRALLDEAAPLVLVVCGCDSCAAHIARLWLRQNEAVAASIGSVSGLVDCE